MKELPVWVTLVISLLTLLVGVLGTLVTLWAGRQTKRYAKQPRRRAAVDLVATPVLPADQRVRDLVDRGVIAFACGPEGDRIEIADPWLLEVSMQNRSEKDIKPGTHINRKPVAISLPGDVTYAVSVPEGCSGRSDGSEITIEISPMHVPANTRVELSLLVNGCPDPRSVLITNPLKDTDFQASYLLRTRKDVVLLGRVDRSSGVLEIEGQDKMLERLDRHVRTRGEPAA